MELERDCGPRWPLPNHEASSCQDQALSGPPSSGSLDGYRGGNGMRKKPRGHDPDSGTADPATGTTRDDARPARGTEVPAEYAGSCDANDVRARQEAEATRPSATGSWPGWARGLVTLGLLCHMAAVVAGAMGVPPSSELERHIADLFTPYHDLLDQGYAYRYYAEPGSCRSQDEAPATACPGQRPVRRFRGRKAPGRRRQPQPARGRLCTPPLQGPSWLHKCHTSRPAALDPRSTACSRAAGAAGSRRVRSLRRGTLHDPGMDWRLCVRRLLSDLANYLGRLVTATRRGWNAFFFTPADPTALGLIRVVVGLLALWSLIVLGLDLRDYFGSDGWADPTVIWQTQRQRQPFAWSFWFLVPDRLLRPVWLACLTILGLYTVGLFSRVTGVLAWVIIASTVRRVPIALFGFDQIVSTLALYLGATFASGQAVSMDRFLRRWRDARAVARSFRPAGSTGGRRVTALEPGIPHPTIAANLALRLIQLHLVFIYAMAGLAKVQGPSWWNGMALWGTMTAGEFVTRDFTALAGWPLV